jgi:hypothetical protein
LPYPYFHFESSRLGRLSDTYIFTMKLPVHFLLAALLALLASNFAAAENITDTPMNVSMSVNGTDDMDDGEGGTRDIGADEGEDVDAVSSAPETLVGAAVAIASLIGFLA